MILLKLSTLLILVFTCSICEANTTNEQSVDSSLRIKNILIQGNNVTRTKIIKLFLNLDSGSVYDSQKIALAERRLESTHLFSIADILTVKKVDGVDLYIIVKEIPYITATDPGADIYRFKHGNEALWWRVHFGFEHSNFRGRMEELKTSISFWDWRSLGISWYKPLLPTPYFISLGARVEQYPDEVRYFDNTDIITKLSVGRRLFTNSKISTTLFSVARHMVFESINRDTSPTIELFSSIAWQTDKRDNLFYPSKGWQFISELKSNHLQPGSGSTFTQGIIDIKYYLPIWNNHTIAAHVKGIGRLGHANPLHHRLLIGGNYQLRGHFRNELGQTLYADNALLSSTEYRFPIWQTPTYSLPAVPKFPNFPSSVYSQIHGALIFDYARLSHNPSDLADVSNDAIEDGYGIGFGLRVLVPQFRQSLALDIVYSERRANQPIGFLPIGPEPFIHAYIGLDY